MQDVNAECIAYKVMSPRFEMADALLGGTFVMKEKGVKYLPQFPGENDKEYQRRLSNAVLRPLLRKATDFLVGHMFREPIALQNVNERIKPLLDDIDRMGTDLQTYAARQARLLMTHGLCFTYTDFPRIEEGSERELSDELTGRIRPYAIQIHPSDLIFAARDVINGFEKLLEVRWRIRSTVIDGFQDEEVEEIRRIRVASEDEAVRFGDNQTLNVSEGDIVWEIWQASTSRATWGLMQAGVLTGLDYIPLRVGYSDPEDFLISRPMLEGVAHKNLEHWRASSDHNSIVQMSRFPVFYATGVDEDEARKISILGPHSKLTSTNPDAKFGYLETSGSAVEQSFKDLERIAREADEQSIEALYKSGSDTATGRNIDLMESLSPAQQVAMQLEFHLNQVIADFGRWLNISDPGFIQIDRDFGYGQDEQRIIDALHKARALGDISRSYYLKRLQDVGVIDDEADPDTIAADAENEAAEAGLTSQFGQGLEQQDLPDQQDAQA